MADQTAPPPPSRSNVGNLPPPPNPGNRRIPGRPTVADEHDQEQELEQEGIPAARILGKQKAAAETKAGKEWQEPNLPEASEDGKQFEPEYVPLEYAEMVDKTFRRKDTPNLPKRYQVTSLFPRFVEMNQAREDAPWVFRVWVFKWSERVDKEGNRVKLTYGNDKTPGEFLVECATFRRLYEAD